ncbi:hypothetical protein [Pseudoflavonifractor sp. MSJ-37]|uniref:hypothetical protein n=1 Tax=Pseudoflavonifractor sp. MSJ-37 TaxID=2841531 RepID=UPI001C101951|nr:hypothetical protein [Pseudoflavonifractor sp. MSJ-37]MBU5435514.1 hypothetical protein [Pseudoflavonifractor sp. MSJ-37]
MCQREGEQLQQRPATVEIHRQEDPVQVHAAPQQIEEHRNWQAHGALPPQLAQPVRVQAAAPAPAQAGPVQQRQLSRKEQRTRQREVRRQQRQEAKAQARQAEARRKAQREEAKQMAAAKLRMDQMIRTMREQPIPGQPATDYEAARPLNKYADRGAYLERVILTQIKDEALSRYLLGEVRNYERVAAQDHDQRLHELEFRQRCIPLYLQDVLHQEMPEAMRKQLERERRDFYEQGDGARAERFYQKIRWEIFRYLDQTQQTRAEDRSLLSGAQKEQYEVEVERLMKRDGLTREEARRQRAEDILRQRRPITLRKLEEIRAAHLRSREHAEQESEYFHSLQFANEDIQKEFSDAPKLDWDRADHLVRGYLSEAMRGLSCQIRVPNCAVMAQILDSGRFKTQMETHCTTAVNNEGVRKAFSQKCFGIAPEALPLDQYEIYGYASHGDLVKESSEQSEVGQGVRQYGQIVVKLRQNAMKGRTTMSMGDSLDALQTSRPSFMDQPDLHAVSHKARYFLIADAYRHSQKIEAGQPDPVDIERALKAGHVGYLELQYHGGVRVEDIESVTLIADYASDDQNFQPEQEMPPELAARLKSLGIRAAVVKDGREHEL